MLGTKKPLQVLRGESVNWEEWEAQLMPRDQCGWCRRRLLIEAFAKYEFQRKDRPAFCKDCTAEMKSVGEKWCKACNTWAAKAGGVGSAQHDGDGSIAEVAEAEETKKTGTLYCAKCKGVKGKEEHARSLNRLEGSQCKSTMFEHDVPVAFRRQGGHVGRAKEIIRGWGEAVSEMRRGA